MARTKKPKLIRKSFRMSLADDQALESVALTLDRDAQWVICRLARLAIGTIPLSADIRRWLRGDTAFDVGLPGDQQVLMTIENPDPPVARAARRKTVGEDPPSLDEVRAYVKEKGYHFDPEVFYAFYETNGWKQSNKPMLSWKSACVTFEKNPLNAPAVAQAVAVSDWGKDRPAETEEVVDDQTLPLVEDGGGDGYLDDQDA